MILSQRDLHVRADGTEIGAGCRIILTARETLSLRPALHRLEIHDLSESSAALLADAQQLEVSSNDSILAFGEVTEVLTSLVSGERITSAVFAPGLGLWNSSVSLSLAGGMLVSETIRELLSASGTGIPLAGFAAPDLRLSRPQAFFGRTCDALSLLAETAGGDAFLSPAGVCVSGRSGGAVSAVLFDHDLLSEPVSVGNHVILSTSMVGWGIGSRMEVRWQGTVITGRIISRLVQADNGAGPWKSELELEVPDGSK